jgi:aryl-alcohol dehydrogenase-like predicted oxidoreductase
MRTTWPRTKPSASSSATARCQSSSIGVPASIIFSGRSRRRFPLVLAALQRDNRGKNEDVVANVRRFAEERGMTPAQLAVAWALAKKPQFVPLVGAKTRKQLADSLGALDKPLAPSDVAVLEALVPEETIAGSRYGAEQMAHLDSEK